MDESNSHNHLTAEAIDNLRRNPPRLLSQISAATYIGISTRLIRDLTRSKKIKAAKLGGRLIYRLQDVDDAIERLVGANHF